MLLLPLGLFFFFYISFSSSASLEIDDKKFDRMEFFRTIDTTSHSSGEVVSRSSSPLFYSQLTPYVFDNCSENEENFIDDFVHDDVTTDTDTEVDDEVGSDDEVDSENEFDSEVDAVVPVVPDFITSLKKDVVDDEVDGIDDKNDDDDEGNDKSNDEPYVYRLNTEISMIKPPFHSHDDEDSEVPSSSVENFDDILLKIKDCNEDIYNFISNIHGQINHVSEEFLSPNDVLKFVSKDVFPVPGYQEVIPIIREFYVEILKIIYLKTPNSPVSLEALIKLLWYSLIKTDSLSLHIPRPSNFDEDFFNDLQKEDIRKSIKLVTSYVYTPSNENIFWICMTCIATHTYLYETHPEIDQLILDPLYEFLKIHTNISPKYSYDDVQMKLWDCAFLQLNVESPNYKMMRSELQLQLAYIKYKQSITQNLSNNYLIDFSYLNELIKGVREYDNPICAWELVCIISNGYHVDMDGLDIEKLIEMAALGGVSEAQFLFQSSSFNPFSEALIPYSTVKITDHIDLRNTDCNLRMGVCFLPFMKLKSKYASSNTKSILIAVIVILVIFIILIWIFSILLLSKHDDLEDGAEYDCRVSTDIMNDGDLSDDSETDSL